MIKNIALFSILLTTFYLSASEQTIKRSRQDVDLGQLKDTFITILNNHASEENENALMELLGERGIQQIADLILFNTPLKELKNRRMRKYFSDTLDQLETLFEKEKSIIRFTLVGKIITNNYKNIDNILAKLLKGRPYIKGEVTAAKWTVGTRTISMSFESLLAVTAPEEKYNRSMKALIRHKNNGENKEKNIIVGITEELYNNRYRVFSMFYEWRARKKKDAVNLITNFLDGYYSLPSKKNDTHSLEKDTIEIYEKQLALLQTIQGQDAWQLFSDGSIIDSVSLKGEFPFFYNACTTVKETIAEKIAYLKNS